MSRLFLVFCEFTDIFSSLPCVLYQILLTDHLSSASERVRCTVGEGDKETVVSGAEVGHIQEVPEYRFFLYRCVDGIETNITPIEPHLNVVALTKDAIFFEP